RSLAILGKAALILRPQPMHHEGKWPPAALGLRTPAIAALLRLLAERRRPRQRQHVIVEIAGRILPSVLRRRRSQRRKAVQGREDEQACRDEKRRSPAPLKTNHDHAPIPKPAAEPSRHAERFKNNEVGQSTAIVSRSSCPRRIQGRAALQAGL